MGRDHETTYWLERPIAAIGETTHWLQTPRAEVAGINSAHIELCFENGWFQAQIADRRLGVRNSCNLEFRVIHKKPKW